MSKNLSLPAAFLTLILACLPANELCGEVSTFVIGNEAHPWATSGNLDAVDLVRRPGWIQPKRVSRDVNLLSELYRQNRLYPFERPVETTYRPGDGRIWTPNAPFQENRDLLRLADGKVGALADSTSFAYFDRLSSNNGVSIYVDLGAPFPVDEIGFYPLSFGQHVDLYLKGYELFANDGSAEFVQTDGSPAYHLLSAVPNNQDQVVVNTDFLPQFMRYIRLRSTSSLPFEIDQLEIRGEGYVRRSTATTAVIDLGDLANLGSLRWGWDEQPGAMGSLQTRVGKDRTTQIYHRINELGEEEILGGGTDPENLELWKALPEKARGSVVDDTENWTLWSSSYDSPGQPVASLGPRQYLQVRLTMESVVSSARIQVDSIAFDYSRPILARRIEGSISPRIDVALGVEQAFTYKTRPRIDKARGDIGFDVLEISTPSRADVLWVKVKGRTLPSGSRRTTVTDSLLTVRLTDPVDRITSDGDSLEVSFSAVAFTYGTVFEATAYASWRADVLGQRIESASSNDVTVQGKEASFGTVLHEVVSTPAVLTPNGDGVNDVSVISFTVFQVIGQPIVSVEIYDSSGRRIRTLLSTRSGSRPYETPWNGLDDSGRLAPPGLYVYRVAVRGDERTYTGTGTVAIVY